jgi:hypothetical protein
MIDLPPLTFSYGVVEKALAVAHGISETVRPAGFRSMVSNLQKHGVLGPHSRVGRGATLVYGPVEMHRLVLALELCELGVPPATAAGLLDRYWESTLRAITFAAARSIGRVPEEPIGNDTILYLGGVGFRTGLLRGEKSPVVPIIGQCVLDELPVAMTQWMMVTPSEPAPPRGLVVNLSARLRAFHSALGAANLDDALAERRAALAGDEPPANARNGPKLRCE